MHAFAAKMKGLGSKICWEDADTEPQTRDIAL